MNYPALYSPDASYVVLRRRQRRHPWLVAGLLVLVAVVSNRCAAVYQPPSKQVKQVKLAEPPGVWACR